MDKVIQHTRLDALRPEDSHGFTGAEVHDIMDGIYARGDRLMQWFLASMLAYAGKGKFEVRRLNMSVEVEGALDLFRSAISKKAVVLLDMMMPRLSGEETLRELRRLYPAVPVLLNSGYSEEIAAEQLLTEPLVGFVQKPYGAGQLLAAIRELARTTY